MRFALRAGHKPYAGGSGPVAQSGGGFARVCACVRDARVRVL